MDRRCSRAPDVLLAYACWLSGASVLVLEERRVLTVPFQCLYSVRWLAGAAAGQLEEVPLDCVCRRPDAFAGVTDLGPLPPAGPAALLLARPRVASAVLDFVAFMSHREEAACARRAGGSPPWTAPGAHPLLSSHHWCNVSRLDDRGTAAFHQLLRRQGVKSLPGVLFCALAYRRLNRLATFAAWRGGRLPVPADAAAFCDWARRRVETPGEPALFTGKHQQSGGLPAYLAMVRALAGLPQESPGQEAVPEGATGPTSPRPGLPHVRQLAAALAACRSAREAHGTLKAHVAHVGTFIAWQVLCDVVEAGVLPAAADDAWVALGPGARSGLAAIFGPPTGGEVEEMARLRALQAAQPWALQALGRGSHGRVLAGASDSPLLLRDLEHSLCEYSKFLALRRGTNAGPGRFNASRPLPLLPLIRLERLADGCFRVLPPAGEELADSAPCSAFPGGADGPAAPAAEEYPLLPPWLPRDAAATPRRRAAPGMPGAPRLPKAPKLGRGPPPARAALAAWFQAFWPSAVERGWTTACVVRAGGATVGTKDQYWLSPAGRRMRSRAEVAAHEGVTFVPE